MLSNKHLFRTGMALRSSHINEIYGLTPKELRSKYSDLVEETYNYLTKGTRPNEMGKDMEYQIIPMKSGAPDIYNMYEPGKKINANDLKDLPDQFGRSQIANALISGYLMHDSRGYYFSKQAIQ